MNERIRELAKQAGYDHPDAIGMSAVYDHFDLEMFAELIVFECVKLAVFKGDADTGRAIKEHFASDVVQQTHSEECWRWHHECAIRKIENENKAIP